MPGIQDYTSVASAVIAVGAAAYTVGQARIQHRREDFELARSLHADLTTGVVAEARDLLGTVTFADAAPPGQGTDDVRRAYFTLLWCFERIEGGRRSMADRHPRRDSPAVAFLDDLIQWHVDFWRNGFEQIRQWIAKQPGGPVSDGSSRAAFDRLSSALTPTVENHGA